MKMKPIDGAIKQWNKFSGLDRSLKMFILSTILFGLFFTVRFLFFNFYILSLGFDKDFLGVANSMAPAATLILGLQAGVLTDRIGRKKASIIGLIVQAAGYATMLLTTSGTMILIALFIAGTGETLYFVSRTPLLTRLTNKQNRDYVFSIDFALSTLAGVVGNSLAGQMPNWFESLFKIPPETTTSYQGVLFASLFLASLALIPIMLIETGSKNQRIGEQKNNNNKSNLLHDLQNIMQNMVVWKLVIPNLLIGFGAALMVPYLNLFFVETFGITNQLLGNLFSAASLVTGLSILAGPWLAGKMGGRIRAIVAAQATSLVFLLAVGFSPWLGLAIIGFLGREALMNMVAPINNAFSMEQIEEDQQGTFNSLLTLSWQVGWTLMPLVSGIIQERYGFPPIFLITGALYTGGTVLLWVFFKDTEESQRPQTSQQAS
jgi:MFS family permease